MAGNLRPIKDPLYLAKAFEKLWFQDRTTLIVGSGKDSFTIPNGVINLGPRNTNVVHSIMQQVDSLVNTIGIEEGMSSSILEAMKLSCPVYADNCGNLAIIQHLYSGFIFEKPEEFEDLIKLPTKDVVNNALNYVNKRHTQKIKESVY